MKTNELKKGTRIKLANGWEAIIEDNMKGNTRLAKVFGFFTEIGSVYSHDIKYFRNDAGIWESVEHTPAQIKMRKQVASFGM